MITEPGRCGRSSSGQRNATLAEVAEHTFDVFFYGLNMNTDLLSSKGIVPRNPRVAWLEDHVVVLGAKAMLLRSHGKRA